ncbi:MAG: MBOAT family protein [Clostridiales bacterium]|nr:MBOAT family protein [Clostridiales bacterium]
MVFSSLTFLCIFLPAVLILDRIFKNIHIKNALLLAASLLFYAYGEPVYVFLMAASAFLNFVSALLIDRFKGTGLKKVFLAAGVAVNLGALVFFKYSVFLTTYFNGTFGLAIPVPDVTLPLGISFFTFQAMSYVIDVYREDCGVQKNFGRLLLYISFFPQLIAGPIVKYRDIEEQILSRSVTSDKTALGIRRFAQGLAKKVFIANNVAVIADAVFNSNLAVLDAKTAWLGAASYMLQIYFDFSGYSDMAIGLGKMFGFEFKENFDHPYISGSIKDFWRRWHISLSTWFKEYLYIPLGGNRKGKVRTVINKFIVFACTGIWHGANWTFLFWGLYHGCFLMIEEFMPKKQKKGLVLKILSHIYLIFVVMIGFVMFRCDSISDFGVMMTRLFTLDVPPESSILFMSLVTPLNLTAVIAGIIFSMPAGKLFKEGKTTKVLSYAASLAAVVLAVMCLSSGSYNPFIYFRF